MKIHYCSITNERYTPQYIHKYRNMNYDFILVPRCTEENKIVEISERDYEQIQLIKEEQT